LYFAPAGPGYRDRDLVFTDLGGGPWKPASIATLFRGIAKRAGLGHLRFHDLRHTAASLMIARGVPITAVAAALGHANTSTTLSVYAHAVREGEEAAALAMEGVLQGVMSSR
jgi:integrase